MNARSPKTYWLAVWDLGRDKLPGGYNRDCYEYELVAAIKEERQRGMMVAGPFDAPEMATEFAMDRITEYCDLINKAGNKLKEKT